MTRFTGIVRAVPPFVGVTVMVPFKVWLLPTLNELTNAEMVKGVPATTLPLVVKTVSQEEPDAGVCVMVTGIAVELEVETDVLICWDWFTAMGMVSGLGLAVSVELPPPP